MKKSHLLSTLCAILFSLITMSANAALLGRLPATPGGTDYQAAYDDVLNITWLTDADQSGSANWAAQVAWAANLNTLGFDDWRLASMSVAAGVPTGTAGTVVSCRPPAEVACDNEMGYMFYQNFGGSLGDNKTGNQTVGDVTFTDVQSLYWSGTESGTGGAWYFIFSGPVMGEHQFIGLDEFNLTRYGWAVRSGDVTGNNISINIPEGTPQECTAIGGSDVTMVGNVSVSDPSEIVSILWYLDGDDSTHVASGDAVEFFVPFGSHSVKAEVTTFSLGSSSDTTSITIEDTIAPQVNPVFINPKDGTVITSVSHKADVNLSEGVIDICDPAPTIKSVFGLPTQEGDTLGIKAKKRDASITVKSGPNIETITLMVTAEDKSGNVSSDSTVLTVTP